MIKKISVLGSTGSIGTQTLEIARYNQDIGITALAAGSNVELLEKQVREFHPKIACLWKEEAARELKRRIRDLDVKVVSGMEGLMEAACEPEAQIVVTAVVGMIGIRPTIAAMEAGKDIALANKETLVTAGHIIMPLARKMGVKILPVDSEHSAIFQCLEINNRLEKVILTASGGPFRTYTMEQIANSDQSTSFEASQLGRWGAKITIDSASMMNKGFEVIEAKWLFGMRPEQIEVVVHPQSVIHSMVQFEDGAVKAQLGMPDMRLPIQYAFSYPERVKSSFERLDLPV